MRRARSSPPSTGWGACMARVRPTSRSGRAPLMASKPWRWASHEHVVDRPAGVGVAPARREHPGQVAAAGHHVGLVDRAGHADAPAEVRHDPLAVAGEPVGGRGRRPAALPGDPAGRREVVERHDRRDPAPEQVVAHPGVVVEGGDAELALGRLDAAPLQREAVVVEAQRRRRSRGPRRSGGTSRSSRPTARRCWSPGRAPSPTSRCSRCRPRSGARPWPRPSGTPRETPASWASTLRMRLPRDRRDGQVRLLTAWFCQLVLDSSSGVPTNTWRAVVLPCSWYSSQAVT